MDSIQAPLLEPFVHGFFTRCGGVSDGVFASLNVGSRNQDRASNVQENRGRVAKALGVEPPALAIAKQVHGTNCLRVDQCWSIEDAPEADGLISIDPNIAVGVLAADCVPVLLADHEHNIVGAVHAGWRGAHDGAVGAIVQAMVDAGAQRSRIKAVVGPSIQQASYEVSADYRQGFVDRHPGSKRYFIDGPTGKPHFDLPGFVCGELSSSGVGAIDNLGFDTCCDEARFFSNRRAFRRGDAGFGLQVSAIRPIER